MMFEFNTKLTGVTFNNRQDNIKLLQPGLRLFWKHERDNPYDSNAILCFADPGMTKDVGHLNKGLAAKFVGWFDRNPEIIVEQVTGKDKHTMGVNVKIVLGD
jgi:single-stranded-DNA-specific exonuclease